VGESCPSGHIANALSHYFCVVHHSGGIENRIAAKSEDGSQARPSSLEGTLWEELSFLVIGVPRHCATNPGRKEVTLGEHATDRAGYIRSCASRWEVHAVQEVLEARVGAQPVRPYLNSQATKAPRVLPIGPLKPFHRAVVVT
jgi:hypothetical protein